MVELSRTLAIRNEYLGQTKQSVTEWLDCVQWIGTRWDEADMIAYRNRVIRDVVLPKLADFEWFMFIDSDVTITEPGMTRFLALNTDVGSCVCRMRDMKCWASPTAFHDPLFYVRSDVFRAVHAPWFKLKYSPDYCDILECPCQWFRKKVLDAGFSISHGGSCGHDCAGRWCG